MSYFKENDLINGQYRLLEFLGEGAFAEVWKTLDVRKNHIYAIKLLIPEKLKKVLKLTVYDPDEFFPQDHDLVKDISHPNILTPLESGHGRITEPPDRVRNDILPFFVLYLSEKGSLYYRIRRQKVKKNTFSEEEIARVIRDIGAGLEELHQCDIIHQDIKPENILIMSDDDGEYYMITDFGGSKKFRATITLSLAEYEDQHEEGVFFTPNYAAPEIFTKRYANPKSDVYSLGVILYEMAYGRRPNNRSQIAPIPSDDISDNLNLIILKCLEENPRDRLSASDLAYLGKTYLEEGFWEIEQVSTTQLLADTKNRSKTRSTGDSQKTRKRPEPVVAKPVTNRKPASKPEVVLRGKKEVPPVPLDKPKPDYQPDGSKSTHDNGKSTWQDDGISYPPGEKPRWWQNKWVQGLSVFLGICLVAWILWPKDGVAPWNDDPYYTGDDTLSNSPNRIFRLSVEDSVNLFHNPKIREIDDFLDSPEGQQDDEYVLKLKELRNSYGTWLEEYMKAPGQSTLNDVLEFRDTTLFKRWDDYLEIYRNIKQENGP